jgi:hypothetical protein
MAGLTPWLAGGGGGGGAEYLPQNTVRLYTEEEEMQIQRRAREWARKEFGLDLLAVVVESRFREFILIYIFIRIFIQNVTLDMQFHNLYTTTGPIQYLIRIYFLVLLVLSGQEGGRCVPGLLGKLPNNYHHIQRCSGGGGCGWGGGGGANPWLQLHYIPPSPPPSSWVAPGSWGNV